MIKPITPQELAPNIPDFVIEIVNNLIEEKWNGRYAKVLLHDIVYNILKGHYNGKHPSKGDITKNHWLCIEDTYRNAGWRVTCETQFYTNGAFVYFKFEKK